MTCRPAPAVTAMLAQLTVLHPNRSRASDGICPSAEHIAQSPNSDHNDGEAGDATHDPINGVDIHYMVRQLKDKRVKYIISNGQIKHYLFPVWVKYFGSNPHTKHAHISIKSTYRDDTSQWWITPPPPKRKFNMKHKPFDIKLDANGCARERVVVPYSKVIGAPNIEGTVKGEKAGHANINRSTPGKSVIVIEDGQPNKLVRVVVSVLVS